MIRRADYFWVGNVANLGKYTFHVFELNFYGFKLQKYLIFFGQNFEIRAMVLRHVSYVIWHFLSADAAKLVQDVLRAN